MLWGGNERWGGERCWGVRGVGGGTRNGVGVDERCWWRW